MNTSNHNHINSLSIDLEDWFQGLTSTAGQVDMWPSYESRVVGNTRRLLKLLDETSVRATFFVLGYIAAEFPGLIREVAEAGHEIALHGYYHRKVSDLSPDEFRHDVQHGRSVVESAAGTQTTGYRAPMFSINGKTLWAFKVLEDLGFLYDSSVFPTRNPLYGYVDAPTDPYHPLPDKKLVEFPLATVRILGVNLPVAGGFYLRVLPYRLLAGSLHRINQQGRQSTLYIHPWDLDTNQPTPNPTLRERFTHYYNLRSTEAKLRALLRDFNFVPLAERLNMDSTLARENRHHEYVHS